MLQNYTNQFMNDYISILKNDFLKIANDLISSQIIDNNTFLTVHVSGVGIINIRSEDVEEVN